MNALDICAIIFVIISALVGFKRGAIRGLVQLIGLVAIVIVSYQFKDFLGEFLIKKLPFFNFGGALKDLYAVNILFYQAIAFIVIFVILYCVLNILITLSGFLDVLVKATIIFEIPSKIIGTIIGIIEGLIYVFIVGMCLLYFGQTQKYVMESKVVRGIVEKTPVVNTVFAETIATGENIYQIVLDSEDLEDKQQANLDIVSTLIGYGMVKSDVVQECIDNGKLHLSKDTVIYTG